MTDMELAKLSETAKKAAAVGPAFTLEQRIVLRAAPALIREVISLREVVREVSDELDRVCGTGFKKLVSTWE